MEDSDHTPHVPHAHITHSDEILKPELEAGPRPSSSLSGFSVSTLSPTPGLGWQGPMWPPGPPSGLEPGLFQETVDSSASLHPSYPE